ncbi:unnamed protein product [Brassicogethes aeneus]|uniref:Uncharacterized protein n=1 Tax=Brassicogethes aeneus TaxID=1431903 RepID=A0A9P0FNU2_BRAAE|nr:unnamed protein product [Brassicogethes aeneus]
MSDSDDSVEPTAEDAKSEKLQQSEKDKAAKSLAEAYTKNTKEVITVKQVMKKLNNIKTKVKEATYLKKMGNKKIVLTDWQKKCNAIWNTEEVQGANLC